MIRPKPTTLLFDFDGTIGDTLEVIRQLAHKWIPGEKLDILADHKLEDLRGKSAIDAVQSIGIPMFKLPVILGWIQSRLYRSMNDIDIFPHMADTLQTLHTTHTMGIVTSNSRANVELFLKKNNLHDVFSFVHSGKSIFGKHLILKRVLKEYNFHPEKTMYIGDEVRDIDAAHKAGLRVISVTWGFNTTKILRKNNPDFLVHTPKELLELFMK